MSQMALFDLAPPRPPAKERTTGVHVMMPNMWFACGRSIVDGEHNGWILGTSQWPKVTCPECLAPGREALSAECQRMQGHQA